MAQASVNDQDESSHQTAFSEQTDNMSASQTTQTLQLEAAEAQEVIANGIVKNHIIASMTLGLVPVPFFDLAALSVTQMNMLGSLGRFYGVPSDETNLRSLLTSLAGGAIPVLSVVGLSSFAKIIPGIGTLAGSASVSVLAGAVTYAVGQVFIMHFEKGGTLEDFDPKQAQAFFKREIATGKTFVANLRDELKSSITSQTDSEPEPEPEPESESESESESEVKATTP